MRAGKGDIIKKQKQEYQNNPKLGLANPFNSASLLVKINLMLAQQGWVKEQTLSTLDNQLRQPIKKPV